MSGRMTTRRALGALALGAVALLLAGCVGLPTSSGVTTQEIDLTTGDSDFVSLPELPQAGASPEEIIRGFVRAGRGPRDGYRVAREFLTDDFRAEWKPNAGVLISNSTIDPQQVGPSAYDVGVTALAGVNASGNYSQLDRAEAETLRYTVEKNADGEWRISSAPDGTVLSETRFASTFEAFDLYFFDASGEYLVPDLRWFTDIPSTKDRIVTELLAGPSPWLGAGVLVTAFPTGTTQGDPVTIESGQATVDLSNEVLTQSVPAKQRMLQQLDASLRALADVQSVRMSVSGFPVTVPDSGTQPKRVLTVDPRPLGMVDGQFGYLTASDVAGVAGVSSVVEKLDPTAVTLGRNGDLAAVLSGAGASFVIAGQADPLTVDQRQGLVAPALDVEGFLWSTPADGGSGGLIAFDADGTANPIALPLPSGARIVSLDISRDGTRLLVGLRTPDGPQLIARGIVRDASLVPRALGGEALELPIGDAPLRDATWVDAVTVAVLSGAGETTSVDLYQLGGMVTSLGSLPSGVGIAGGNSTDGIRVIDSEGTLLRPSTSRVWQSTGITASLLATQQ